MTRIIPKTALVLAFSFLAGACMTVPQGKVSETLKAKTADHETAMAALLGYPDAAAGIAHIEPQNGSHVILVNQEDEFDPSTVWKETEEGYVHVQSGMECGKQLMDNLSIDQVVIFDKSGNDVGCNYENRDEALFVTFYATYAPDISVRDHMAGAYQAVKQRFPDLKPAPMMSVEFDQQEGEEPIESMNYAFSIGELDGKPMKTGIWIAKTYGWHLKVRGTYTEESAFANELLIALIWVMNTNKVIDKMQADSAASAD